MKNLQKVFKVGTRSSELALTQAQSAINKIEALVPSLNCELIPYSSPGDRDKTTDLRITAANFFTYNLDQAILSGDIDIAIHSAKDVPPDIEEGIDWFWLPWTEDQRDVIILPPDVTTNDLPKKIKIGVSSERREQYSLARFPNAQLLNIRGNIAERIAQLDAGDYDMVIMAAAALIRLGLEDRINEYITLAELPPPEGQGILCITFKKNSSIATELRKLFIKTITFVGAGIGNADMCTIAGIKALEKCDVCLHDTLLAPALLDNLPITAKKISVGKRSGAHSVPQAMTTQMILDEIRKGYQVVRLKGGDPGTFGRLSEEVFALENLNLPYHVIPGISSLNAATTGTGMLLTKRGVSRGFCVMTPRKQGEGIADIGKISRGALPVVFFMALSVIDDVAQQLLDNGTTATTPVAIVFNAGQDNEEILRSTLSEIIDSTSLLRKEYSEAPALIIVGECAAQGFKKVQGAFNGKRILLTCSEAIMQRTADIVQNFGGTPLCRPLIRLSESDDKKLPYFKNYDWLVITSPSAVRILLSKLKNNQIDLRNLPKIMTCGSATSKELRKAGLQPDAEPDSDFGCKGLLSTAEETLLSTDKVLRIASDHKRAYLSDQLKPFCKKVTDYILYKNEMINYDKVINFDIVFFASGSAVKSFITQWTTKPLTDKIILAMGEPTADILREHDINNIIVSQEADINMAFTTLAGIEVSRRIEEQI